MAQHVEAEADPVAVLGQRKIGEDKNLVAVDDVGERRSGTGVAVHIVCRDPR